MISCTRIIEFDAGHRVKEHEHSCKYVHGHRYKIEATFEANKLDHLGRVIDFGEVRKRLGDWVNDNWDHTLILHQDDKLLGEAICQTTQQQIFYLAMNPTAENMAAYLLQEVCPMLFSMDGVQCTKIRLYETPNCFAEANNA